MRVPSDGLCFYCCILAFGKHTRVVGQPHRRRRRFETRCAEGERSQSPATPQRAHPLLPPQRRRDEFRALGQGRAARLSWHAGPRFDELHSGTCCRLVSERAADLLWQGFVVTPYGVLHEQGCSGPRIRGGRLVLSKRRGRSRIHVQARSSPSTFSARNATIAG